MLTMQFFKLECNRANIVSSYDGNRNTKVKKKYIMFEIIRVLDTETCPNYQHVNFTNRPRYQFNLHINGSIQLEEEK